MKNTKSPSQPSYRQSRNLGWNIPRHRTDKSSLMIRLNNTQMVMKTESSWINSIVSNWNHRTINQSPVGRACQLRGEIFNLHARGRRKTRRCYWTWLTVSRGLSGLSQRHVRYPAVLCGYAYCVHTLDWIQPALNNWYGWVAQDVYMRLVLLMCACATLAPHKAMPLCLTFVFFLSLFWFGLKGKKREDLKM